jgi:hypothetical protein
MGCPPSRVISPELNPVPVRVRVIEPPTNIAGITVNVGAGIGLPVMVIEAVYCLVAT